VRDPLALGRSAVVNAGQPAPPAWAGCERVPVVPTGELGPEEAEAMHARWRRRQPVVWELADGSGLDDPLRPPPERVEGIDPWHWSPDLVLPGEVAHHALWANSVDARQVDRLDWRWAREAVAVGAAPAPPASEGEVVLPGGETVICDGGPLDAGLGGRVGLAVLHRVGIEHRWLVPLPRELPPAAGEMAPDQAAAVGEPRAGARIIAPAGSGKTRVLTERARALLAGWRLPPAALALVAYNVRAAAEMRQRLADRPELRIRTLNALGLRLCGRSATVDGPEVRRILSGLVDLPRRAETDPAAPWIEALARVRLGLAAPDEVEAALGDVSGLEPVVRAYREELARRAVVDFDEQITVAIERLLADPALRARSQRHARVLLVDEFQDLTPAHLLLLRLLSGPAGAVFGVGDDDQTIYGYTGATPRWLIDFEHWFPGSASHPLEVNYRCPAPVVTAAANLLSRNRLRVPKSIRARAGAPKTGLEVMLAGGAGRAGRAGGGNGPNGPRGQASGPAAATAAQVAGLLAGGARPADVAVLCRVNAGLVAVRVLLAHQAIPATGGGDRRFLTRSGVRAALAWLEVASCPSGARAGPALVEAARRPKRGMSQSLLTLVGRQRQVDGLADLAGWLAGKGSERDAAKVADLAADVELVRRSAGGGETGRTATVLDALRRRIGQGGLDASAAALDGWSCGAIASHADDLEALSELAALEPDPARFGPWLADQLSRPDDADGVTLASVHAVKGQEWPHVVLHHATDGVLPHRLATDREEERRIFHVGLTRGSVTVTVVAGRPPSPFLDELTSPGQPEAAAAPTGAGARRSDRGQAGPSRDAPSPTGGRRTGRAPSLLPEEPVVAAIGLVISAGGHDQTVIGLEPDGAVCRVGAGPARTSVAYGSVVRIAGRSYLLAHPGFASAWERIRSWRSARSRSAGVPAYVIFDDRTLRSIAATLPVTEAALLRLRGVGPGKFEAYGAELLALAGELRAQWEAGGGRP
jgi:DNA helicase-2/ATP-dependent DNA helicase PcrA